MAKMEVKEKVIEERFDAVTAVFAQRAGYQSVPWFRITWIILWIYTMLTIFVLFHRPDFINMTICIIALYMMFNTDRLTRTTFRGLVLSIFLSLIYDLIWFALKHSEYSEDLKHDGGIERGVRNFSLTMSYLSFIVRVGFNYILSIYLVDICCTCILERFNGFRKDNLEQGRPLASSRKEDSRNKNK